MKRRLALAAAAVASSSSAPAADWWWIGSTGEAPGRVVTYLDKETVRPLKAGVTEAWTLAIGEQAIPNGQQHQATHYAIRCEKGTFATLGRIAYDAAGSKIPLADPPPTEFAPAKPGSIGETLVRFVCGNPSGIELQVPNAVEHAFKYLTGQAKPNASPEEKSEQPGVSVGTAFFVGPEGKAITSYHVVAAAKRLECRTPDGKMHAATVMRASAANDLALLHVDTVSSNYLSFAPRGSSRPGDRVFTIGYGAVNYLGINEPRFTDGTISALSGLGAEDAYMQISVPVQPGNSGGPLLNEQGQVVGIIAAQAAIDAFLQTEGTLPQNINWAVKSDYAAPLANTAEGPKRNRDDAIKIARQSLCLIVAEE